MSYPNSGALFKNDRKRDAKDADYNGSCEVAGVEYWLNAWIKDGKKGKFMSLSLKPKNAPKADKPKDDAWRAGAEKDDDGPPF